MNEGWIKIFYKLQAWEWYGDPNMVATWIHLLLSANWKNKKWRGIDIKRGQIVTSVSQLSQAIGQTEWQTRSCLERLENSKQILKQTTNKFTIITICNYDYYQATEEDAPQTNHEQEPNQTTNKPQTNHKQTASKTATPKEDIEDKKERIKESKTISSTPLPPKGETAPRKKEPKEPPHAVTRYDKAFEEIYQQHTGQPFAWSRRENVAVNAIVGKISTIMVAQGQIPTDDTKLDAFKWFIRKIVTVGDEWMKANLTPHIIDSKFNEYYQRIKSQENGTARNNSTNNPYGVSDEYIAKIARELGGVL